MKEKRGGGPERGLCTGNISPDFSSQDRENIRKIKNSNIGETVHIKIISFSYIWKEHFKNII